MYKQTTIIKNLDKTET